MWYDVNWLDRCKVIKKVNTPQIIALFFYVCLLVMMLKFYNTPCSLLFYLFPVPKRRLNFHSV